MRGMVLARSIALGTALVFTARIAPAQTVETYEGFGACDNNTLMGVFNGIDYLQEFTCYAFSQPPYNPASGTNRLRWNTGSTSSADAFFSFGSATTFQGAFFSGSSPNIFFELFLNNVLVATSGILNATSTPTFLSSGYNGQVDKVRVIGEGNNAIMDDLTWGGQGSSVAPEPATLALIAPGLGMLGMAIRRRRKTA